MKKLMTLIFSILLLVLSGCNNEDQTKENGLFYVANAGEGTISIIDPTTNKEVDKIELGTKQASHGIALSPDGQTIYSGTGFEGMSLIAINATTKEVENEISFDQGVHGIDIGPDGKYVYVSLNPGLGVNGGSLATMDTESFELVENVDTGNGPAHVAVSSSGKQVWVANVNDNSVSVIDTATNNVLKTIEVGEVPNEVAITPDEKFVFVANVESDLLSVIGTGSLEVIKTIEAGDGPHGVTVSPDGTEVWVSNNNSNDIYVIDTSTLTIKTIIPTGSYANHTAFSEDGKWVYVTNRESNDLVKIDQVTKEVTERILVGAEPHEISLENNVSTNSNSIEYTFLDEFAVEEESSDSSHERIEMVDSVSIEASHITKEEELKELNIVSKENIVFRLSLTTHSGNLSELGLEKAISLIDVEDNAYNPTEWIVESADAHHPSYIISFPQVDKLKSLNIDNLNNKKVVLDFSSM
ncbi:hypothetical protein GCM10011351_14530 [Paraliobacillus quinghaiensis]|uniref:YNCE-like beta-propeller domain-containing protein n=1 Tax=Paraliobacillus quinghaiensis TaxID=470815 RepID=A0A917TMW3_9BACI|nr:YncE family protein [Paraliobacillus quinghaiensis]GGM29530.1 hypothetical protein GCM10011351_14530 [Paraliobacillus quinghaiensis]